MGEKDNAMVSTTIEEMATTLKGAKANMERAQDRMRRSANRHRREMTYEEGDKVWLRTKTLPMREFRGIPPS